MVFSEDFKGDERHSAFRPLLHSREEASRLLSVSLSTLKLLIGRRELCEVKVGKRRLIARSEIERFICERTGPCSLTDREQSTRTNGEQK